MSNIYLIGNTAYNTGNIVVLKYSLKTNEIVVSQVHPKELNIALYPNPVKNTLNISFISFIKNKIYKCFIYDVSGNLLQTAVSNNTEKYNAELNVSNLRRGMYTLKISDGINIVSKTFLKE